jgi:hypothetical protein
MHRLRQGLRRGYDAEQQHAPLVHTRHFWLVRFYFQGFMALHGIM